MDDQARHEVRAAAYLATRERLDFRASAKSAKTRRGKLQCTPGNKPCGARCIPNNWNCRIKGEGRDNHTTATRSDPLAGVAAIQRGTKDLVRGVATVNPARVERGRNSVIRGVVKLAPGSNVQAKKDLQRKLKEASTPIAAVLGLTMVGLASHIGLKRGFEAYRNGVGADVDRAAARAVDTLLDRLPGTAGPRAERRAAGQASIAQVATVAARGVALEGVQQAAATNLQRLGPLSFRSRAADYEASNLTSALNTINERARTGGASYDEWQRSSVQALFGARSPGTRAQGQRGSVFSEHAANEFLVSKFGLNGSGVVGASGGTSIAARNALLEQRLGDRLAAWGETMRSDMRLRRLTGPDGAIRGEDIETYIRQVGGAPIAARMGRLTAAQQAQYVGETTRLMRSAINGNPRLMQREARSMRRALVDQYDVYFTNVAQSMQRNAAAADSPFGDGLASLARYVDRRSNGTRAILSRDHADLILRDHYHTRVMRLSNDYTIGADTARRVAQTISRSSTLPDTETAFRILNQSGFPRLSPTTGIRTGRAPARLPSLTELASRILARAGNENMSRAAAMRAARTELAQRRARRDHAPELVRTATYLAARADFKEGARLGKPCGASHIPKAHECRKGNGASAPESDQKRKLATIAAVAGGAVAIAVAGSVAYNLKTLSDPEKSPLAPSPGVKDLVKAMKQEAGTKSASEAMGYYYTKKSGLKPGDVVYFRNEKDPTAHFGIYLGEGKDGKVRAVIANTNKSRFSWTDVAEIGTTKPGVKTSQALMTPLVKAPDPKFKAATGTPFTNEEVVKRAIRIAGTDYKFSLTKDNCEALANGIAYGVPESEQLQRFRRATRAVVDVGVSRGQRREGREAIYQGRARGRSYTATEFVTFLQGQREFSSPEGKDLAKQYAQYFEGSRLDAQRAAGGLISPDELWSRIKTYGPAMRAQAMADYLLIQRSLVEMDRGRR